ncbi:MAG: hypothetical protein HC838_11685, partial [Spirulinaceae cyanobacterium RM2_2_10]|nr:hypothetical protein [Spirulinaceae cyanobacterium RM2_2_10]
MYALSLALGQFVQPTPICPQGTTVTRALEILRQNASDQVIAVSERRVPLGIVHLHRLLPYLASLCNQLALSTGASPATSPEASESLVDLDLIEPIAILPAHLCLADLLAHIRAGQLTAASPCALVDAEGRLLGLLDCNRLAQALLIGDRPSRSERPNELVALSQLLDQLPIPIAIKTQQGEVVQNNAAWREHLAADLPSDSPGDRLQAWCNVDHQPAEIAALPDDLPADLPAVWISYAQIEQVLRNLLENALHYAPAGAPIGLRVMAVDQMLQVEVTDRGPGVPAELRERIFAKFV